MYNIDTVKKRSLKGADKMKKIPGVDMEKAADLEILAENLSWFPRKSLFTYPGVSILTQIVQKEREDFAGQRKGSGITHEPAF